MFEAIPSLTIIFKQKIHSFAQFSVLILMKIKNFEKILLCQLATKIYQLLVLNN